MNPGLAISLRWHVAIDSVCNGDKNGNSNGLGVDDGDGGNARKAGIDMHQTKNNTDYPRKRQRESWED